MELEIMAESSVHNLVLKRRRSKRQRPSADDALTMTSSSSPSQEMMLLSSLEAEEDQEVANCLILLAQGPGEYQTEYNDYASPIEIVSSRKMGESGLYECKTCNRFFHSFQALGGHRASHKKLKVTTTDEEHTLQKSTTDNSSCRNLIPPIPIPTLQLGNNVRTAGKIRVHQCLICCAEFPSGQALGGHMRKHRINIPLTETSNAVTTAKPEDGLSVTLSLSGPAHEEVVTETSGSNNEFHFLDLNLPAAASSSEEDEISLTKFSFTSKQRQQAQSLEDSGLVLSGPALVDCHY